MSRRRNASDDSSDDDDGRFRIISSPVLSSHAYQWFSGGFKSNGVLDRQGDYKTLHKSDLYQKKYFNMKLQRDVKCTVQLLFFILFQFYAI